MKSPTNLAAQISEVEREIAMRNRNYERFIKLGYIKDWETAQQQLKLMQDVLKTLKGMTKTSTVNLLTLISPLALNFTSPWRGGRSPHPSMGAPGGGMQRAETSP
jgi:hypothetical protein